MNCMIWITNFHSFMDFHRKKEPAVFGHAGNLNFSSYSWRNQNLHFHQTLRDTSVRILLLTMKSSTLLYRMFNAKKLASWVILIRQALFWNVISLQLNHLELLKDVINNHSMKNWNIQKRNFSFIINPSAIYIWYLLWCKILKFLQYIYGLYLCRIIM